MTSSLPSSVAVFENTVSPDRRGTMPSSSKSETICNQIFPKLRNSEVCSSIAIVSSKTRPIFNRRYNLYKKKKKDTGRKDFILQFFDLDVSKPNDLSMVLETNSSRSGKVFECGFELVGGTIGVFSRLLPIVEIDSKCVFSIEVKGNNGSITDQFGSIPLTHWF